MTWTICPICGRMIPAGVSNPESFHNARDHSRRKKPLKRVKA